MNRTLIVVAALAGSLPAHADRPLSTNNADVHDAGACVVETGLDRATQRGSPSANGLAAAFACGTGWRTEAGLGYAQARAAGVTVKTWGISGKTAVVDRQDRQAGWSIGWGLDWISAPGSGTRREGSFVNGIVSAEAAPGLLLHANLGWSRSRSANQDSTGWGLALEKGLGAGVELLAETFASDRDRSPWINLGLRWAAIPEHLFVDVAWAVQTTSSRPKVATIGLRAEF